MRKEERDIRREPEREGRREEIKRKENFYLCIYAFIYTCVIAQLRMSETIIKLRMFSLSFCFYFHPDFFLAQPRLCNTLSAVRLTAVS